MGGHHMKGMWFAPATVLAWCYVVLAASVGYLIAKRGPWYLWLALAILVACVPAVCYIARGEGQRAWARRYDR